MARDLQDRRANPEPASIPGGAAAGRPLRRTPVEKHSRARRLGGIDGRADPCPRGKVDHRAHTPGGPTRLQLPRLLDHLQRERRLSNATRMPTSASFRPRAPSRRAVAARRPSAARSPPCIAAPRTRRRTRRCLTTPSLNRRRAPPPGDSSHRRARAPSSQPRSRARVRAARPGACDAVTPNRMHRRAEPTCHLLHAHHESKWAAAPCSSRRT